MHQKYVPKVKTGYKNKATLVTQSNYQGQTTNVMLSLHENKPNEFLLILIESLALHHSKVNYLPSSLLQLVFPMMHPVSSINACKYQHPR